MGTRDMGRTMLDVYRGVFYLSVSIEGMEGVGGEGGRDDPSMMRFMQRLVYKRMMQSSMNPVNQTIGEHEEQRKLEDHVPPSIIFGVQV